MIGKCAPRWPSLIAVVESVERQVMPELGVPLSIEIRYAVAGKGLERIYRNLRDFGRRIWIDRGRGKVDECWRRHRDDLKSWLRTASGSGNVLDERRFVAD